MALVTLSLSDPASGQVERLTCTPDHPLYVSGKGWVEAGDLGVGTSIVTRAGPPVVVKDIQWQRDETGGKPFTVYNLTVQGDHTYFAGDLDGGVWVHNAEPCDLTGSLGKVKQLHDERFGDQGFKADRKGATALLETTAGDYIGMNGGGLHAEQDAIAQARADGLTNADLLVMNVSRRPCPGRCTPLLQDIGLTTRYWYRFKTWQAPW